MDPAKETTANPALPKESHNSMASISFPEKTSRDTKSEVNGHMKHEVDDASIGDVASNKGVIAPTQVNGQSSEAFTAPAPRNDEAATKSDLNVETKNPALGTDEDLTGDNITANPVNGAAGNGDTVNGDCINGDAVNGDAANGDAANGDPDRKSKLSPIPLTNGHLEGPVTAPNEGAQFDDIWSPATKLKRRLEKTKDLIVCPGVYDGFSARIALSVGFDAMYMVRFHSLLYS